MLLTSVVQVPTTSIPDEVLSLQSDAPGFEGLDFQTVLRSLEDSRGAKRKEAADTYVAVDVLLTSCLPDGRGVSSTIMFGQNAVCLSSSRKTILSSQRPGWA